MEGHRHLQNGLQRLDALLHRFRISVFLYDGVPSMFQLASGGEVSRQSHAVLNLAGQQTSDVGCCNKGSV